MVAWKFAKDFDLALKLKITVIGGSGFVGTNLCRKLTENEIPFEIIDLQESKSFPEKSIIGDVRNLSSLRSAITGNTVINLAAVHRDDVSNQEEYYQTNVLGAENIGKICIEKNIKKIIFTSTVAVYGFAKPGIDENGPIQPFNEYGRTKHLAEKIFQEWGREIGNSLIIVRPTVLFGEGNRGNVFNLFNQIDSRRFIMVGSGKNFKSMAYIGNFSLFLLECIKSNKVYGLFNYVDTPDLDMNTLVQIVSEKLNIDQKYKLRIPYALGIILGFIADIYAKVTRTSLPISSIRIKKFCSDSKFTTQKDLLNNFKQSYSLKDGIHLTLSHDFISPDPKREVFITE